MLSARVAAIGLLLVTGVSAWLSRPVAGVVFDKYGPLPGALVRFQGADAAVLSDSCGRFLQPPNTIHARPITAWLRGYAIGSAPAGQPPLSIQLFRLPVDDNEDYQWQSSTPDAAQSMNCGNCHAEIHTEWAHSGHARSATNPRFLREFRKLAAERPDDIGVCAKCHAPTFRDPGLDYDLRKVHGVDRYGVHCDFCHKIAEAPVDKIGTRFGVDGYQLLRPGVNQQLFFGPLDDAVREGEQFAYSPLYRRSQYCASCHEGVIYGVHVYGTYSEWLESPARRDGKECQSCHMAPTGKLTNIAPGSGGVERDPLTLASHLTPGATPEMLRRCLSVKASVAGRRVDVTVRADHVGHRVPTGFIDRNLVLVVEGFDTAFHPLALTTGPTLPQGAGPSAGVPGKIYAKRLLADKSPTPLAFWQPHDDVLDTRLSPGRPDSVAFLFSSDVSILRVRLLYRRQWLGGEPLVICDFELGDPTMP
jgi:hypothetical protein